MLVVHTLGSSLRGISEVPNRSKCHKLQPNLMGDCALIAVPARSAPLETLVMMPGAGRINQ